MNQLTWHNRRSKDDGRTKSLLLQSSTDASKMEHSGETTSLTDLRLAPNNNALSVEGDGVGRGGNNKMMISASMGDINEVDSGLNVFFLSFFILFFWYVLERVILNDNFL